VSALAVALYVLAAAAYLLGFRRAYQRAGAGGPRITDAVLVQCGLLISLLSLVGPLSYWSQVYLWIRAIQDIFLAFVGPALIAAGRPWLVLRRPGPAGPSAAPSRAEQVAAAFGGNEEPDLTADVPESEPGWSRSYWPLVAVVLFNVAWLGWHVPAAFDLAERNSLVRAVELVSYFGIGIWFWVEVADPRGSGYWHQPLRRLAMVTATVAAGTVLGMALVFGAHVDYPAYANSSHRIMTVLDDQQLSGAVLWMGVLPSLVVAGVALLNSWLNQEERDGSADASADASTLAKPRTTGWPARPRLR
jgi:putative membrane protein